MTDTTERIHGAVNHSTKQLDMIRSAFGDEAVLAYAAGLATGARNYVAEHFGRRAAFDLYAGLTDEIPKLIGEE